MIGSTLSHYEITAELGRGGMGIVYKARDTKLDRDVAIKVLPSAALASADDRERFYREAKSAAALHHPNIASVFEIDEAVLKDAAGNEITASDGPRPFIAMEFIDGQTLQDLVREGPLKLSDAVKMASQVAEALKAAHAKNIVHRDIKSANVMVTADGVAKVLDFGLAKTNQSTMLTRMGSTLGTVAYMSPEQARGQEVDGRSDLYSLGTVLYEMVAGRLPFAAEYEQAVVYSILNEPPEPLTAVRTGVPMDLERIVNKLLSKDADYRYQTAADLLADLKSLDLGGSGLSRRSVPSTNASGPQGSEHDSNAHMDAGRRNGFAGMARAAGPAAITAAAVLAVVLLTLGWLAGRTTGPVPQEAAELPRYASVLLEGMENVSHPGISHDGRFMSFTTNGNTLWLYDFSNGSLQSLDQGGDVRVGAFSPDSRWLAYESRGSNIFIVQVPNGIPALLVADAVLPAWIDNEWLLVGDATETGLDRFSRVTQQRTPVYVAADGLPPVAHTHVLPGGKTALISVLGSPSRSIGLLDLEDGSFETRIQNAFAPRYVASGHILFSRGAEGVTSYEGEVHAQPFDLESGRVLGQPIRVMTQRGFWEYGINRAGDMVTSRPLDGNVQQAERDLFLWRAGGASASSASASSASTSSATAEKTPLVFPLTTFSAQLTRDEEWILYIDRENDKLMYGRVSDGRFAPVPNTRPQLWNAFLSDDDNYVYYTVGQFGTGMSVFKQALDGSTEPEELDLGSARHTLLRDVRGDAEFLITQFGSLGQSTELAYVNTGTGARTVISREPSTDHARFSPDGNWIAWHYAENDRPRSMVTGIAGEGPWLVSDGYPYPVWTADGTALFLYGGDGIYRTDISTERGVRSEGAIAKVYEFLGEPHYNTRRGTDTFLILDRSNERTNSVRTMEVILSWGPRLRELAPID